MNTKPNGLSEAESKFWDRYQFLHDSIGAEMCDAPGGAQYQRVLQEWNAHGRPGNIDRFIAVRANLPAPEGMTLKDFRAAAGFVVEILVNHGGRLPFSFFEAHEGISREIGLDNHHWLDIVFGVLEQQDIVSTAIDRTKRSLCGQFFEYVITLHDRDRPLKLSQYVKHYVDDETLIVWDPCNSNLPVPAGREYIFE